MILVKRKTTSLRPSSILGGIPMRRRPSPETIRIMLPIITPTVTTPARNFPLMTASL